MDKYQSLAFSLVKKYMINCLDENGEPVKNSKYGVWTKFGDDLNIIIDQDENYNYKKYGIIFYSTCVKSITYGGKEYLPEVKETGSQETYIEFVVDFDNKIPSFTINFIAVDPIEISITYNDSNKEAYDTKIAEENKLKNGKLIHASHKTGTDLVNIYWDLVNDSIETVKINLYTGGRLIAKYKESEAMFKSIGGLAFGEYEYEIIELDSKDNEIAKTNKIRFNLNRPDYGGKPTIVI